MSHFLPGEMDDGRDVRIQDVTRVVLRPLASPLPLGILALAFGSILLTSTQLKWIAASNEHDIALVILVLVVPLELLSAIVAFLIRDAVMATGLGILVGSWAASGTLSLIGQGGARNPVFGILAVAVGISLLVPAIAAGPAKPAASALFTVAAVRFALVGVYELGAPGAWQTASGVLGVVLVVTALYSSVAFGLEDARHHSVLPVSRRSTSSVAMSGNLDDQLETLPTEAGVRQES